MHGLHFYVLVAMSLSSAAFAQTAAPSAPQPQQVVPAPPAVGGKAAKQYDPQRQCVDRGEFANELRSGIRPVGEAIMIDTNFLPANQHVDVGVRAKYVEGTRYFAGIDREDGEQFLLHRQDVLTRRASDADPLVKKHLLDGDETIVTLTVPDEIAGLWRKADLYLYICSTQGSPAKVSRATIRLSPYWASMWICGACVFFAYLVSALVMTKARSYIRILPEQPRPREGVRRAGRQSQPFHISGLDVHARGLRTLSAFLAADRACLRICPAPS